MSFSFESTAGASQSTSKPELAGNEIYSVKFDGCEAKDITGVKDPSQTYKTLLIKFSNEDGYYTHTIFEPKPDDFKRTESEFNNKNGNKEKIQSPSNVEGMMLLFKHLIDAINPELASKIDKGEQKIAAPNWDGLRKIMVKATEKVVGAETKIKLVKNNKNRSTFPSFFTGLTREGKAYIRNNFIGEKLAFTPYEITKMNAKPTNMAAQAKATSGSENFMSDNSDLNVDLLEDFNL